MENKVAQKIKLIEVQLGEAMKNFLKRDDLTEKRDDLTEFAQRRSDLLDEVILQNENTNGYIYAGGNFVITYLGKDKFKFNFLLYFKDPHNRWFKITRDNEPYKLKRYLTDEAIAELKEKKKVRFNIDEPVRSGRLS